MKKVRTSFVVLLTIPTSSWVRYYWSW